MRLRLLIPAIFFILCSYQSALAQCCCATNLGTINPNGNWQYFQHSCLGYVSFPAQAGCTYIFTYCSSTAPSAYYSGDPYLTLNTTAMSGTLISNDDYCGLGSFIQWTAPATQTYYLQLGSWAQGASCACNVSRNLGYRSTNCAGGTQPPTSITASPTSLCAGQSTTLTANGTVGTQNWYTGSCGGTFIGTGATITVTPATTTTYYVNNNSNGQASPTCASITVTVNPSPPAPTASNVALCGPGSATLTASGGNSYVWYANSNGTGQLGTGSTYTTPVLQNTTTYYVGIGSPGGPGSSGSQSFSYTGGVQTFTAPATGNYNIVLRGGRGGNGLNTQGGFGGEATGGLALTAGQTISVYIGGQGGNAGGPVGWNGGGQGGIDVGAGQHAGSGGGGSDIRVGGTALANRVIVAGGGGGGGRDGVTGVGGGSSGTTSANYNSGIGGTGGTQVGGGLAGILTRGATNGSLGQGGAGSTGYNAAGGDHRLPIERKAEA